jgi:signal peptidase I
MPENISQEPSGIADGDGLDAMSAEVEAIERYTLRRVVRWLMIAFVLLALVRVFVFEPYRIPSGSMKPTIMIGDVLLVNKLPYRIRSLRYLPFTDIPIPYMEFEGWSQLERGDLVVFELPSYSSPDQLRQGEYVKRCVAVAGDTVALVDGRIQVNGVETPPAVIENDGADYHRRAPINRQRAYELLRPGGDVIVPYRGYTVPMDSVSAARWRWLIESEGSQVEYRNRIVFLGGLPATQYTFQRNYFFALGDNSSNSFDSRFFGFVPYNNLIGEPLVVYWSREPDDGIRWDRIGKLLH